jgi:Fusaric acid resistance protein-like
MLRPSASLLLHQEEQNARNQNRFKREQALIFITPLALMISGAVGTDDPIVLAGERIVDTLLGAFIALVVLWTGEWVRAQHPG